jgi:hypothetical protein
MEGSHFKLWAMMSITLWTKIDTIELNWQLIDAMFCDDVNLFIERSWNSKRAQLSRLVVNDSHE